MSLIRNLVIRIIHIHKSVNVTINTVPCHHIILFQIILEGLASVDCEITSKSDLPHLLQVILECVETSDTFSFTLLPVLQSAAVQHESVNQLVSLIGH